MSSHSSSFTDTLFDPTFTTGRTDDVAAVLTPAILSL